MLHVILTSYNRPKLLQRAVNSILAQTDDRWHLYLMDDNSNKPVLDYLKTLDDKRITINRHKTIYKQRQESSRYAALINEVLPTLKSGVVGYLCDNVEYKPGLVEAVLSWFEDNPGPGYVTQERDCYRDGKYLGAAVGWGHWATMPNRPGISYTVDTIQGHLDHSQVFHKLPVDLKWSEDIETVTHGDADFYMRLAATYGPIRCISAIPLTLEHIPK